MTQPNFIAVYLVDPKSKPEPLYLLLRRSEKSYLPGIWQMVTGKLEAGEVTSLAALREIREETSLSPLEIYNVDVTLFYEQSKNRVAQSANFCAYVSKESPITLAEKEHDTYRWCTFAEASALLAFPAQKETLSFIDRYYVREQPNPVNLIKICAPV